MSEQEIKPGSIVRLVHDVNRQKIFTVGEIDRGKALVYWFNTDTCQVCSASLHLAALVVVGEF